MTVRDIVNILANYTKVKIVDDAHEKYLGEFRMDNRCLVPKIGNETNVDDILDNQVTYIDIDREYIHEYECHVYYLCLFIK